MTIYFYFDNLKFEFFDAIVFSHYVLVYDVLCTAGFPRVH